MKKNLVFPSALLLLAGMAIWLCQRGFWGAPSHSDDGLPQQTSGTTPAPHRHLALFARAAKEGADKSLTPEVRLRRLLAEMTALIERTKHLSSDNIDEFKELAEINNEFCAGLDKEKAELLVKNMPAGFTATVWGDQALRFWAGADRMAAAEWMAAHPSDSPISAAAIAHNWITNDAQGLYAYLDRLPDGTWKHNVTKSAGEDALVSSSPLEAINLLHRITGDDARRDELYEWAATKWAISDPSAAANWADKAGDPLQREKLLSAVAIGYANKDPQQAAEWAVTTIKDPDALQTAVTAVVRLWANEDAARVAQWVQQFPAGVARDSALDGLLAIWMRSDSTGALNWQKSLDSPALREHAGKLVAKYEAENRSE